jgi:hypothetical protein
MKSEFLCDQESMCLPHEHTAGLTKIGTTGFGEERKKSLFFPPLRGLFYNHQVHVETIALYLSDIHTKMPGSAASCPDFNPFPVVCDPAGKSEHSDIHPAPSNRPTVKPQDGFQGETNDHSREKVPVSPVQTLQLSPPQDGHGSQGAAWGRAHSRPQAEP